MKEIIIQVYNSNPPLTVCLIVLALLSPRFAVWMVAVLALITVLSI